MASLGKYPDLSGSSLTLYTGRCIELASLAARMEFVDISPDHELSAETDADANQGYHSWEAFRL